MILLTLFVAGLRKVNSTICLPKRAGDLTFALHEVNLLENLLLAVAAVVLLALLLVVELAVVLRVRAVIQAAGRLLGIVLHYVLFLLNSKRNSNEVI